MQKLCFYIIDLIGEGDANEMVTVLTHFLEENAWEMSSSLHAGHFFMFSLSADFFQN